VVLRERLYAAIGAPLKSTILLLPVRSRGKTVALTYGDFGDKEVSAVPLQLLEILAGRVGLQLENAFYRKKLEKVGQ
jgi:GAF domain-containing protein